MFVLNENVQNNASNYANFEMKKKKRKILVHIGEFLKSSISLDIPIRPAQTLKLYLV